MAGIIGKKIGMSSIFNANGEIVSVTVIQAGPCKVVTVRTKEKDGYEAVQLGFGVKKEKNINKPVLGQYKKSNLTPSAVLKEFSFSNSGEERRLARTGSLLTISTGKPFASASRKSLSASAVLPDSAWVVASL